MRSAPLAVSVLAVLLSAAPAQAGTYDVWSCAGPTWRPAPIAGWTPVSNGAPPPANLCATGQGLRAELQGLPAPAGAFSGWAFEAPAGVTIASYELYRAAVSGAAGGGPGQRAYGLYHDEPRFEPTVFLFDYCVRSPQGCLMRGDPAAPQLSDPDNVDARSGLRIRRLILRMECFGGGGDCPAADPPGWLAVGRARISLADDAAPALAAPAGPLVTPEGILDGAQAVTASATDVGGGVERFDVVVDGTPVASEPMGFRHTSCRAPYVDLVPCPREATVSFAFDTARVANGRHDIQIAAVDTAGNRTLSAPVGVWIANGGAANGTRPSRSATLTARFTGARRRTADVRVPFGRTRPVRGRLTDQAGSPIANARVEVLATPLRPGATPAPEGSVLTNARGRFRYTPRRGPSRRLEFGYRAFSNDPVPSATARLSVQVRAGLRLIVRPRRTTSRGSIRFRGRLLGGPGRAGVQVAIYAVGRDARSRVPVTVLRTGQKGRFRFRYRFLRTFAPFTYRFVARVERQRGYPYAAGESRVAVVRVVR